MLTDVLVLSALALGAWGAGGCGPVGAPTSSSYEWKQFPSDPGRSYLYYRGVQVAGYDHAGGIYRSYDAATDIWSEPQPPPWEHLGGEREMQAGADAVTNYGVDTGRLNGHREESYRLNGEAASREQARQAIGDPRLPDDAGRLRLTVIGDPQATARVTADVAQAPMLAEWKDRLVVQSYAPEHWTVARSGFVTSGKPTIYLQAPTGQVLHRQDDYADGAEGLARALRRADPAYDAKKDPDLRQRLFGPHLGLASIPVPVWILAGGAVYAWLRRR
jgi:hypothetical protein